MNKPFNNLTRAPIPVKAPYPAHGGLVKSNVPVMKASAQGSLQHKRAHMHKDKARNK